MKVFASILFIYIIALTAIPSVRAVKITLQKYYPEAQNRKSENCDAMGCEKGKIIMTLSFSPSQYFNNSLLFTTPILHSFALTAKEKLNYKSNFIDQYHNSIWQPPKILSSISPFVPNKLKALLSCFL
jgi:hypothetical protein